MSDQSKKPPQADDSTIKPWGGRFSEATDAFVERFTASVVFDQRLYRQDIRGSLAHAQMLNRVGILTAAELAAIEKGSGRHPDAESSDTFAI